MWKRKTAAFLRTHTVTPPLVCVKARHRVGCVCVCVYCEIKGNSVLRSWSKVQNSRGGGEGGGGIHGRLAGVGHDPQVNRENIYRVYQY